MDMGIIQCALDCRYQCDGYCELNAPSTVNAVGKPCPHFISRKDDCDKDTDSFTL